MSSSPRRRQPVVHSAPLSVRDANLTLQGGGGRSLSCCDNTSLTVGLLAGCIIEMLIALINAALSLAYLPRAMSVMFMCHLAVVLIVCGLAIFGLFINQRLCLAPRMFYQMVTIVGYCLLLASCSCLLAIYSKNKDDICQTGSFRPRVGKPSQKYEYTCDEVFDIAVTVVVLSSIWISLQIVFFVISIEAYYCLIGQQSTTTVTPVRLFQG